MDKVVATALQAVADVPDGASLAVGGFGLSGVPTGPAVLLSAGRGGAAPSAPWRIPAVLNPQGGAIALRHPLGASGARLAGTVAHQLARKSSGVGVATLCTGVGQGLAVVLERQDSPRNPMSLTQHDIDQEIAAQHAAYEKRIADGAPVEHQPRRDYRPYRSSVLRHPKQPPVTIDVSKDPELVELSSPAFGERDITEIDNDLTRQHNGEPIGERITVSGRLLDRDGRPVRGQLVEIWQANSAGRYAHQREQHAAPLDPNFTGVGRTLTDDGGCYTFTTIQPGPYPWRQHRGAWRPAHIHFSLFGTAFTQRLVTQMYFPSDPLFPYDPIIQSVTDDAARQRLVATYDHSLSVPEFSMGYHWDIVLDGPNATWHEEGR